jgi:hypothetical protein
MAEFDAPQSEAPAAPEAPSSAPAAPASPAPEPSRREVIAEAVAKQRAPAGADPKFSTAGERARAPDGKFAPAAIDRPAADRTAVTKTPVLTHESPERPEIPHPDAGDEVAAVRPPPGWSPASKVAFDTLPDSVKADIAKREREVDHGFAKLAKYKPVDKYVEMAERGGTTLDKALEQYTGIENLLRRDVFAGVEQVLRNVGVNPLSFAQAYLQRSAGQPQTQAQPQQPGARQPAPIDPNAIVRQATEAVRAEYQQREVQGEVQRFAADPKNRFFENVKATMGTLINSGIATDLKDAYDKACRLDPTIAPLLNQPAPVDPRVAAANQARGAARATTGAPSPGLVPGARALDPNLSRRDMIRAAVAAQKARA